MSGKGIGKVLKYKPQRILVVVCTCIALLCIGMVVMISRYPTESPISQLESHAVPVLSKRSLVMNDTVDVSGIVTHESAGSTIEEESAAGLDAVVTASSDASAEDLSLVPECPVQIDNAAFVHYGKNDLGSSWKYQSGESLDATVAGVLDCLQRDGWTLKQDQTLDLFGDFWGCIAQDDESVLMVVVGREDIALAEGNKGDVLLTVVEMDTP